MEGGASVLVPEVTVPYYACVALPRLGKIPIRSLCAWKLFLAAGGHLAWRQREKTEGATLVSGLPRGPQEPEAALDVVPDPGPCSWTQEGKAGSGGGKMGGESQGLLGGGGTLLWRRGRGGVRSESLL